MADPMKETKDDRPLTRKVEDALGVTDADRKRAEAGMTASPADRPATEKVGEKPTGMKNKEKDREMPGGPLTGPLPTMGGEGMTPGPEKKTSGADWDMIQNPGGCGPEGETDYGTRPVSELKKPTEVTDKADLAATRMLDREKMDREKMDREAIMSTATMEAAAMRTGMASKDMSSKDMPGKEATRMEPMTGERMIRQGAAIGTEPTRPMPVERPMTGTVVPPGTERVTSMKPYGTVDERSRMHAEDPSVHPDWETQPQINAPRDVGIQTPEGQADAARIREGRRRSDEAKEPRLERRGEEVSTPLASGARVPGTMTEKARDIKETTKEKARDVKEEVDRKI